MEFFAIVIKGCLKKIFRTSLGAEAEKFTIYPLPTRVRYTREIDFDDEGGIWTSNSNTPGWHIETEKPQIIRLLEHGTARSELAAR